MDNKNNITVYSRPSPFKTHRDVKQFHPGTRVDEMVRTMAPKQGWESFARVYLDGCEIVPGLWSCVKPKPGKEIHISFLPGKGGGKNPLATILSIGLFFAAPGIGAALSSSFGMTQGIWLGGTAGGGLFIAGSQIMTGVVSLVGMLAIRAIAPPPKQKPVGSGGGLAQDTPTKFFNGASNQVSKYGVIPQVLGKHRMVPPLGAYTYTETVGNDQFLRMLFIWGYGPLNITDLKIGETALSKFDDVEIETRYGYDTDSPITLYSNQVQQTDLNITLKQVDGYQTRTTSTNVDEISVDITFPNGLVNIGSQTGKRTPNTVQVEIQYAPTGTSNWSAGFGSFLSVSSQSSADMPSLSTTSTYKWKQINLIVVDSSSGVVSVINGEQKYGFDSSGNPISGLYPEPVDPIINNATGQGGQGAQSGSSTKRLVARVVTLSGSPVFSMTDKRSVAIADGTFQDSNSFVPTTSGSHINLSSGGLKNGGVSITATKTVAVRKSFKINVPNGTYDVRVKRVTADDPDPPTAGVPIPFSESVWTALRSVRHQSPVTKTGLAMTALRIKATDQLNGFVETFNGIVQPIMKSWNGSSWVDRVSSNPADIFRYLLQGPANSAPLADSRIDLTSLQDWATWCNSNGFEYNNILQSQQSLMSVLTEVASIGRAQVTGLDGKWGIVQDVDKTTPTQYFSHRNSFNFSGIKGFETIPQAIRVQFENEDKGWAQDERLVFFDGYNEDNTDLYDTLQLPGVTNKDQAWKTARYHMAVAKLRPEIYTFTTDIENLRCTKGDLIGFVHDIPLFGLGAARVTELVTSGSDTTGVVIDEELIFLSGTEYVARFRQDDTSFQYTLDPLDGEFSTISFPAVTTSSGPQVGDLVLIGTVSHPLAKLRVKNIEPQSGLNAILTCVDAASDIYTADQGTIPDWDSNITVPAELLKPPTPVLMSTQSDETVLIQTSRGLEAAVVITLAPVASVFDLTPYVQIREVNGTDYFPAHITQNRNQLIITEVESESYYDIRIRYKNPAGLWSDPLEILNYQVVGDSSNPSDVITFIINTVAGTAYLSWSAVPDLDLDYYQIKFNFATTGATWANSVLLREKISGVTTVAVPASTGTYLIKAFDKGGRESANETLIVANISAISGFSTASTVTEDPSFSGTKTHTTVVSSTLRLSSGYSTGEYAFNTVIDLGAVYTTSLETALTAVGLDSNSSMDDWTNVDLITDFDQAASPTSWNVKIYEAHTNDNPSGSPTWTGFAQFGLSEYQARGFKFKAVLESEQTGITPSISALSVSVNVDTTIRSGNDVTSNSTDTPTTITYSDPFYSFKGLTITAQSMSTGDYYTITNPSTSGFEIIFKNSAGTRITRTFDYIAAGAGTAA